MHSMGIGGGFLMVYRDGQTNQSFTLDSREVAPLATHREFYKNVSPLGSLFGPLAVAVPGEMHGLYAAHKRFGKLPWSQLLQPVILLVERGFVMNHELHQTLQEKLYFKEAWTAPSLAEHVRELK
ncbi:hypothetical protein Ciccas_011105 [Cichlidogyrus casuarinus]|uniref:Uncharacterized protein n=1 Tax=Cichlidogyrus casuarinus TaxID=1844966 RepID=A0ABD2PU92_9PLAT